MSTCAGCAKKSKTMLPTRAASPLFAESATALKDSLVNMSATTDNPEQDWAYKQALMLTLSNAAYEALLVLNGDCEVIAINNAAEILFERQRPIGESLLSVTGEPDLDAMVQTALAYQEEVFE